MAYIKIAPSSVAQIVESSLLSPDSHIPQSTLHFCKCHPRQPRTGGKLIRTTLPINQQGWGQRLQHPPPKYWMGKKHAYSMKFLPKLLWFFQRLRILRQNTAAHASLVSGELRYFCFLLINFVCLCPLMLCPPPLPTLLSQHKKYHRWQRGQRGQGRCQRQWHSNSAADNNNDGNNANAAILLMAKPAAEAASRKTATKKTMGGS